MKNYTHSIILAIISILIFAVSITNILKLNALESVQVEEYLKVVVFITFGLLTSYISIAIIKPEFKISRLVTVKAFKFDFYTAGLLILTALTIFFIYSTAIGLINGELRFFGHREVDWAIYENNKAYYFLALLQHIFGVVTCIALWVTSKRPEEHE